MKKKILSASICACAMFTSGLVLAQGYEGVPRTYLFNPEREVCISDTSEYAKEGPYTIGFSNAGVGDSWRVVMQHSLMQSAADNADQIERLIITDAGHDDAKQASDIQDLVAQDIDILIVSANTQQALDPTVRRVMRRGVPVVMVDRRVESDSFVTYVTASNALMGRMFAQWIVEKLDGEGNVIMLGGQPGSSTSENREIPAKEVFSQYPGINVLETVYSNWSPAEGKRVMQAMIAKYGEDIDAVWSAHGLQTPGSIEAFLEAGYASEDIPMHTNSDVNGGLLLALEHGIPMLEIGYPASMGGESIEIALNILKGTPVPCTYQINSQIAVTEGDETPSVRADLWVKDMAISDGASNLIITGGMGPDYDPGEFSVDYPD